MGHRNKGKDKKRMKNKKDKKKKDWTKGGRKTSMKKKEMQSDKYLMLPVQVMNVITKNIDKSPDFLK